MRQFTVFANSVPYTSKYVSVQQVPVQGDWDGYNTEAGIG